MKTDATAKDVNGKRITPTSLAFEWSKLARSDQRSDSCLTSMHLRQLKHFIKSTDNQASEAMYFAVENWYKFTLKVVESVNPTYIPVAPDITFMCTHCGILLTYLNEKDDPCSPIAKNPKAHYKVKSPVNVPEPTATLEDVQATLAQLVANAAKKPPS